MEAKPGESAGPSQDEGFSSADADEKLTMQGLLARAKMYNSELKDKPPEEVEILKANFDQKNGQMELKLRRLKDEAKTRLNTRFQELQSHAENDTFAATQLIELREQLAGMVGKFGDRFAAMYDIAMKKINEFQGTSKTEVEAWYNDVLKDIDALMNDACGKLRNPSQ